jgi:integrase
MIEVAKNIPDEGVWDLSKITLSQEQKKTVLQLLPWLFEHPSGLAQAIAKKEAGAFDAEQMRLLEQKVIAHFRPLPAAAGVLKVLCKLVDAINLHAEKPLPVPRIPNLIIRPKNPFRNGLPKSLGRVRFWRNAMEKNIQLAVNRYGETHELSEIAQKQWIGKLFLSAILHGGMVDGDLIVALARALLNSPDDYIVLNGRLAVEMSIAWRGEGGSEHRYWYPDALTAIYIAYLPDNSLHRLLIGIDQKPISDQQVRTKIWQCISAYCRLMTIKVSERPQSLTDLLRCAQLDIQTRLPLVLANYAGRKLVSHSPGKQVLTRLYGLPIQPDQNKQIKDAQPADSITKFNQKVDDLNDIEPSWLGLVRKAFSTDSQAEVLRQLDVIASDVRPASVDECFISFALFLMTSLSYSGNKLAVSTARAYMVTVAKRLAGRLDDVDPRTLDAEILETLYTDILDDVDQQSLDSEIKKTPHTESLEDVDQQSLESKILKALHAASLEDAKQRDLARNQRKRIARALCEFHHFLVQRYQFEPINPREVLGIGKGLVPVDANLITPDEYAKIYQAIPETIKSLHPSLPAQAKLSRAAQLIFMLAFKCGLRRMEVLKLKIADLCEHAPAELLIRPSDARRLKTKSATRKMPLYALLSERDLAELRAWKAVRRNESTIQTVHVNEQFLFGIPELGFEVIPQDTLFPVIHHAMRGVTGDLSLRFHHLRHSFANWTFLRLMLSDFASTLELFQNLPETNDFLSKSKQFRDALYGRADPTRRHVYAIASLLGHSGPEISLEHYVHISDLLLMLWLEKDLSAPSEKMLMIESGFPQSTNYRLLAKGVQHIPYRLIKNRWPNLVHIPKRIAIVNVTPINQVAPSGLSLLDDPAIFDKTWQLLYQHEMHGMAFSAVAESQRLSEKFVIRAHLAAAGIGDMKVSKGNKGYRHRMIEIAQDRRQKDQLSRLACPVAPHTERDKAIVEKIVPNLQTLIKEKPEFCWEVFQYFLENTWQTRNEIIFKDPENSAQALKFIIFLDGLGIKKSELQFVSYDVSNRSANLAIWKEKLGLSSRHHVKKISPPRKDNLSAKKWLGIKPVFPVENAHALKQGAEEEGSVAFRYLMVLGAIICFAIGYGENSDL